MRQVIDSQLGRAAQFADRHERAIAVAGAIWLAISSASYAFDLKLPEIPFVTDENAWMFSGGWNAAWWGFIRPAIEKRRANGKETGKAADRLPGS